jgi:7-keto-8-aminopelargonate synthetase-like enzyme
MTDAVIDEIDGRMIRIGDKWLADFASCNYLGFDLEREIIDAVPLATSRSGEPIRVGRECSGARFSTRRSNAS